MQSLPILEEEFDTLKRVAMQERKHDFVKAFVLMYYCGFRVSEAQQFSREGIKDIISNGYIDAKLFKQSRKYKSAEENGGKEQKKVNKYRRVPISKGAAIELNTLLMYGDDPEFIKPKKVLGKNLNNFMHRVLGSGYSTHGFRRGTITKLIKMGFDLAAVQHYIGHASEATTMRYRHVDDEDRQQMADAL